MHAWVTGATGFVGRRLVERLVERGDTVIAIVRPSSKGRAPRGAEIAIGDLPDVRALAPLARPDVVFHCAAAIEGSDTEGRAVHVDAALRLAELAPAACFVYVSTTDVLPEESREPLTEATQCAPVDAYGRTKLEGERRLLEAHPGAVVLRPPGVYGPGATRDVVLDVARRIARRTFYYVGTGSARRSWIFVDNLVDAMLHVAEHPKLTGKYLVDDSRSISRREFAEVIACAIGRRAHFPSIPVSLALAAAWTFERACPPLGIRAPATLEGVRRSLLSQPLDTARWKASGFSPRFNLPEGIARTIRWERATGRLAV